MKTGPSMYTFLKEGECAKYNPYTKEANEETKKKYTEAVTYMKAKDIIPYSKYESLKPLTLEILYSFEVNKLPYYTETNRITEIIKILIKIK